MIPALVSSVAASLLSLAVLFRLHRTDKTLKAQAAAMATANSIATRRAEAEAQQRLHELRQRNASEWIHHGHGLDHCTGNASMPGGAA